MIYKYIDMDAIMIANNTTKVFILVLDGGKVFFLALEELSLDHLGNKALLIKRFKDFNAMSWDVFSQERMSAKGEKIGLVSSFKWVSIILATLDGLDVGLLGMSLVEDDCDDDG
ncbi:hypothetical protein Tco_1569022 [Tanacetum coccineum]